MAPLNLYYQIYYFTTGNVFASKVNNFENIYFTGGLW